MVWILEGSSGSRIGAVEMLSSYGGALGFRDMYDVCDAIESGGRPDAFVVGDSIEHLGKFGISYDENIHASMVEYIKKQFNEARPGEPLPKFVVYSTGYSPDYRDGTIQASVEAAGVKFLQKGHYLELKRHLGNMLGKSQQKKGPPVSPGAR